MGAFGYQRSRGGDEASEVGLRAVALSAENARRDSRWPAEAGRRREPLRPIGLHRCQTRLSRSVAKRSVRVLVFDMWVAEVGHTHLWLRSRLSLTVRHGLGPSPGKSRRLLTQRRGTEPGERVCRAGISSEQSLDYPFWRLVFRCKAKWVRRRHFGPAAALLLNRAALARFWVSGSS